MDFDATKIRRADVFGGKDGLLLFESATPNYPPSLNLADTLDAPKQTDNSAKGIQGQWSPARRTHPSYAPAARTSSYLDAESGVQI